MPQAHPPVLAPALLQAIEARIARGEQSLLLLNRRGYAPVLHCGACGWKSGCPHCSAWRVFHKADRTLRCHHCGFAERVPRACPDCGNLDIAPHRPRHREAGGAARRAAARRAHRAHRRRQHARRRHAAGAAGGRACRRGGRAGGHADGGQGARLPPHHAGGGGEPRRRAVRQRLPRRRTPVRAADAGGRPRRPRRRAVGRRQRDVGADLAPAPPAVRGAAAHDFAAFAADSSPSAAASACRPLPTWRCCAPRRRAWSRRARSCDAAARPRRAARRRRGDGLPGGAAAGGQGGRRRAHADAGGVGLAPRLQRLLAAWLPTLHGLRAAHKGVLRWAVDVDPLGI
jgi:primosomal protein N' (replication factor Y) (superfamily II helicase)